MRSLLALLVTAAAAVAAATSASAADMPLPSGQVYTPAPYYQPALYNWTGVYVGGIGGANVLDDNFTYNSATTGLASYNSSTHVGYFDLIGGAQVGADYEFAPFVVGIAGSWLATNLSASTTASTLVTTSNTGGIAVGLTTGPENLRSSTYGRWYATATGRVGYAANDLLVYAKGGAAWGKQDYVQDVLSGVLGIVTSTQTIGSLRSGFTVGAGLEYGLTEHISAVFEYDFLDFGTKDYNFNNLSYYTTAGVIGTGMPVAIADYIHEFMLGINVRFN
jgi:outer membrane immunogenic protein